MQLSNFPVTRNLKSRLDQVDFSNPGFGKVFSDHMFQMVYADGDWKQPEIVPYGPMEMEPGVAMLHYGQTVFEGFKAFRGVDGKIRIFRPDKNAQRFAKSCERLCIPMLNEKTLTELMIQASRELVALDHQWVPPNFGQALYMRPLVIGTEATLEVRAATSYRFMIMTSPVGGYFQGVQGGVSLKVEEQFTRAASVGGLGAAKTAANYAAGMLPTATSRAEGYDQVLWLDGNEHKYVEEVGAMNIFFKINGTVVTPQLSNSILPGVVRDSVLTLLKDQGQAVEERRIAIAEVAEAARTGKLEEVFCSGTAAVISPVERFGYQGEELRVNDPVPGPLTRQLYDKITGLYYGQEVDTHGWLVDVPLAEPVAAVLPAPV